MTNTDITIILTLIADISRTIRLFDLAPLEFVEFLEDDADTRREFASYTSTQINTAIEALVLIINSPSASIEDI